MKSKRSWRGKTWVLLLLALGVGIYIFYTEIRPTVIFGLREDYTNPIPYQQIPVGLQSLKAEECGSCHVEIYEEWKSSIHAQAFHDPFFQAYWKKDNNIWVCLNCHTPLENQQPTLIQDLPRGRVEKAVEIPNYRYDPEYQQEGVTCAACHVRDGVILGPYDDSVAPHPTQFDPSFRTTQVCYRCHNVVSGPMQFYNAGPCGTYPEYEGKFFMKEKGLICQSCHMPEVERPVAKDSPIRFGRRHLWRGGHDPEMVKRAVAVQVQADPPAPKPGDDVTLTLTLINAGAGHKIPTGDPDRYFTVEFTVRDPNGTVVHEQSDTMGRWILWQPVIVEVYDNRLLPLASRDYTFGYQIPEDEKGWRVQARIRYHIQTDSQHQMLRDQYDLTAEDPYVFTIYERDFPLDATLSTALQDQEPDSRVGCKAPSDGFSPHPPAEISSLHS
jgi:hypothetical protein